MWQCRYGLARETNCQAPPLSPPRQFANRHQQRFNRPSHPFNRNMNGRNTQLPVTVLKELVCTCMTDMWNGAEELPRGPSSGWPLVPIPLLWPMASQGIWSIGYDNYIYILPITVSYTNGSSAAGSRLLFFVLLPWLFFLSIFNKTNKSIHHFISEYEPVLQLSVTQSW